MRHVPFRARAKDHVCRFCTWNPVGLQPQRTSSRPLSRHGCELPCLVPAPETAQLNLPTSAGSRGRACLGPALKGHGVLSVTGKATRRASSTYVAVFQKLQCFRDVVQPKNAVGRALVFVQLQHRTEQETLSTSKALAAGFTVFTAIAETGAPSWNPARREGSRGVTRSDW